MTEKRQLLAIMFTDIVGYTAMMGESEPKTLEVLKKNRELHHRFVRQFRGEYLQEIGDGTLASFQSAVDAVGCALDLQRSVQGDPDLNLRVGIHLGDVISEGGDVIGDAVNVASRIEPLAATGGICVSGKFLEREPSAEHATHSYIVQAGACDALGREREARAAVARALGVDPGISVTSLAKRSPRKDRAAVEQALATLRRLGLPE
jgi:class 3 adenylate cyclase